MIHHSTLPLHPLAGTDAGVFLVYHPSINPFSPSSDKQRYYRLESSRCFIINSLSIPWQAEMLEAGFFLVYCTSNIRRSISSEYFILIGSALNHYNSCSCYQELNVFGPNNTPSPDLRLDLPPEPEPTSGCLQFLRRKRKDFSQSGT